MAKKIEEIEEIKEIEDMINKYNIVLNVYIVHCSDFKDRKTLMEENKVIFEKMGIELKWNYIEKYKIAELKENIQEITKNIKLEKTGLEDYDQLLENLHLNQLSNIYNHLEALSEIKKHYNEYKDTKQLYLVLEDDVFVMNTIDKLMPELIDKLIENQVKFDMLFFGIPIVIGQKNEEKLKNDVKLSDNITLNYSRQYLKYLPSCDSYMINPEILNNDELYKELNKVKFTFNFELSYIIEKFNLKTYYTAPHFMLDGSKMGVIPSSINLNNIHIYSNEFMEMVNILNLSDEEFITNQDKYEKEFNTHYEKLKVYNNPDVLHLNAILHNKMKKHETALNIFKHAHDRYQQMPSNITNESNFIIDYVKTYEKLQ